MKCPFSTLQFLLLLVFVLFGLQSCNAQKKNVNDTKQQKTMEPIVTKEFEKFDQIRYEKLKIKDKFNTTEYLSDGTYVEMDEGDYGKQYIETSINSYFQISKSYYKSGNIKRKSLSFNWFAFGKGISYEFDEQGNLVKEIDYDKNYKFTFEDILKFCEKENILVEKGPILQSTGFHTSIRREFIEASKKATWTIERLKSTDRPNIDNRETITIDGTTGQVLSRKESPYVNN